MSNPRFIRRQPSRAVVGPCTSRWLVATPSCRTLLAGLALGLASPVPSFWGAPPRRRWSRRQKRTRRESTLLSRGAIGALVADLFLPPAAPFARRLACALKTNGVRKHALVQELSQSRPRRAAGWQWRCRPLARTARGRAG